jgi:cytochrome c
MAAQITGDSAEARRVAIGAYGCGSFHSIPGLRCASGAVGPELGGIATHAQITERG